jgi:hypothetical protein
MTKQENPALPAALALIRNFGFGFLSSFVVWPDASLICSSSFALFAG